jgi:hypothetical protein
VAALTLACLAGGGLPAGAGEAEPEPGEGSVGIQLLDAPVPPELPDGSWTIAVHVERGTVRNFTTARISFSGDTEEAADAWVIPWLPILGVVLGLALLTVGGLVVRARHTSRRVPGQARVPRAQGSA